jgi:hypothetical protein
MFLVRRGASRRTSPSRRSFCFAKKQQAHRVLRLSGPLVIDAWAGLLLFCGFATSAPRLTPLVPTSASRMTPLMASSASSVTPLHANRPSGRRWGRCLRWGRLSAPGLQHPRPSALRLVMRNLMQPLVLEEKMRLDARSFFHSCLISGIFDPPGHLLGARAHERPLNKAAMSALPPKADIRPRDQDVCFRPKADIPRCNRHVRFPKVDIGSFTRHFVGGWLH